MLAELHEVAAGAELAVVANEVAIDTVAGPRDQSLSHAVLQAVLDGNYERADFGRVVPVQ